MTSRLVILLTVVVALAFVATCNGKVYSRTLHGVCTDCDYHKSTYAYCSVGIQDTSWDYCSVSAGLSTRGDRCQTECESRGKSYMWCWLEKGGWDYCGRIEELSITHFTKDGKECQNYCYPDVCRTSENLEGQCSLIPGITASWEVCQAENDGTENSCGYHGYSYMWCNARGVQFWNWDYCSLPSDYYRGNNRDKAVGFNRRGIILPCPGENGTNGYCEVLQYIDTYLRNGAHLITYVARRNETNPKLEQVERDSPTYLNTIELMQGWRELTDIGTHLNDQYNRTLLHHGLFYLNKQLFFNDTSDPIVVLDDSGNVVDWGTRKFVSMQVETAAFSLTHTNVQVDDGWADVHRVGALRYITDPQFIQLIFTAQEASIRNQSSTWVWQRLEDAYGHVIGNRGGRWDGRR